MSSFFTQSLDKIKRSRVVFLTGAMGSGKSLAAASFRQLAVPVIDSDLLARAIHQEPQHPVMGQIAWELPYLLADDGRLQRGILRTVLVSDAYANRRLQRLLKPYVLAARCSNGHCNKARPM